MKTKKITLILCAVLLCISTALGAESDLTEGRPRIGILLDMKPLPDLLIKHLRLEPGQGIRISNVQQNSPADKAGLERDDIIIGFEGEQIKSNKQLIDAVQQAGVGTEVSLEIIHLGERKTVKLQLEALEGETGLKYPSEPDIFQSWRPGKMFRLKPGDKDWMEIELPFDGKSLEVYDYHHSSDGANYSISIEGNPDDEDTKITVRIGRDEYKATVGEIDKLPEKYREIAQKALEDSRKYSQQRIKDKSRKFYDMFKPDDLGKYLNNLDVLNKILKERQTFVLPHQDPNDFLKNLQEHILRRQPGFPGFDPDNKMFDRIEERMRELQRRMEEQTLKLQQRMEELEKRFKEIPEPSTREIDKDQI